MKRFSQIGCQPAGSTVVISRLVQGKIFAGDAMQYGEAWTVDATHELLEMLGDPETNTILPIPYTQLHCFQEVCDAVEADRYAYHKDGVLVSDFVLPGYFTGKGGPHFDFAGHLTGHVPTLLHGGYLGIQLPDGQWMQIVKQEMRDERMQMSRRAKHSHRTVERIGVPAPDDGSVLPGHDDPKERRRPRRRSLASNSPMPGARARRRTIRLFEQCTTIGLPGGLDDPYDREVAVLSVRNDSFCATSRRGHHITRH